MKKVSGFARTVRGGAADNGAASALYALASRHEAMLAAVPEIIVEVDVKRVYTWANRAAFAFFGNELLGKEAAFYFEGNQETYRAVQPLFEGDLNVFYVESWQHRQDGEKRLLAWWCRALTDSDGKITGALSAARDITDNRRAEEALRESEATLRSLIDGSPESLVLIDTQGTILAANATMAQRLGKSRDKVVGVPIDSLMPDGLAQARRAQAEEVIRTGQPVHFEDSRNGMFFSNTMQPIKNERDQIVRIAIMARDITGRKQAELALQKAHDELERKVEARTAKLRELAAELTRTEHRERRRIAALLHDDLQQILVAVKCQVASLRTSATAENQQHAVTAALGAVDDALQLTRTLSVDLRPPVLDELGLVAALDWLASHTQERYGLAVDVQVQAVLEPVSEDVRVFVYEAVRELLLNVVKHASVKTAQLQVSAPGKKHLKLVVRDRGTGFDAQQTQGWGVGLFNIRERVRSLGGRFEILSHPGKGTTATLTLPYQTPRP